MKKRRIGEKDSEMKLGRMEKGGRESECEWEEIGRGADHAIL